MPRVTAPERAPVSRSAPRAAPRATPRGRARKAAPMDRLTARKLFFRRVKRSIKPGLWFLAVVLVLFAGASLIRALPSAAPVAVAAPQEHSGFGLAALAADAGLRITRVEILGAKTTDPAALAAAIGVQPGMPALGFSLAAIKTRVEALGPVQTATVARELPGTLVVSITERNAFAIWQTGSGAAAKFVLIDKSGNIIADQDAAAAKRREPWLLLLTGAGAPASAQSLMTELSAYPSVNARVTAAERVDGLRWNLVLKDQTLVKLPADDEAGALAELARLQDEMALLDRPVQVIDLRLAGRLVIRPYPADKPT